MRSSEASAQTEVGSADSPLGPRAGLRGWLLVYMVGLVLADPAKGALGGVDLVEKGVRVTVSGNGAIPLDDLIDVGASILRMPTTTSTS